MLGSIADAEDVVQDAFLCWNAADRAGVVEPNAFTARRASRLCLGLMKSASARSRPGHRGPRRQVRGVDSVRDALRHGSPDRLGHAIAAFTDEAVLAEVAERAIHVEFCPSSNLALGVVPRIADHPMARAHQLGLSYSTNTDDPGRSACSLTSEFELVAQTFGFGAEDFARIFDHTMQAAFADR